MEIVSTIPDDHHHHDHHHVMMMMQESSKKYRLSLEDYLSYIHSRNFHNFNAHQLNIVVSIHGFKKLKNKKHAMEAVKEIKPINPARSTLNEEISSSQLKENITFQEALKDLKSLNWQECSISSITTIKHHNPTALVAVPPPPSTAIPKSKSQSQKAAKKSKNTDSGPSKVASLTSAESGQSKSDDSNNWILAQTSNHKKRSRKSMKSTMLASSTSCTSGPSNSSGSDGCVSSLAVVTQSSD